MHGEPRCVGLGLLGKLSEARRARSFPGESRAGAGDRLVKAHTHDFATRLAMPSKTLPNASNPVSVMEGRREA